MEDFEFGRQGFRSGFFHSNGGDGNTFYEMHFDNGGGPRFRSEEDRKRYEDYIKSRMKSHLYQGYKGCEPGKWMEIALDEFKRDIPEAGTPKFWNKPYFYVQQEAESRDYIINNEFGLLIFYDHMAKQFVYLRHDGRIIPEKNLFESEDDALAGIKHKIETAPMTVTIVDEQAAAGNRKVKLWRELNGI